MLVLFIAIAWKAIVCTTGAVVACQQIPPDVLKGLIAAGAVELIFEIRRTIRIYRNIRPGEKFENQKKGD